MLLLLALCVVALLSSLAQCTSIKCSYNMYGRPSTSDAAAVVQAMPFARKDPDDQMAATRIFAEPTYLKPSFNYLKNEWPTRMVQLPMIWRFKTARIALLMYADADGRVKTPVVSMDWATIRSATLTVEAKCLGGQHSGGVWIVSDLFRTPLAALYIYESGSPFESVITQYMISGKGVDPLNPGGLGLKGFEMSLTVPEAVLGAKGASAVGI